MSINIRNHFLSPISTPCNNLSNKTVKTIDPIYIPTASPISIYYIP